MASGVVTTAAMATVSGNMTGMAWMSPAEKKRALNANWNLILSLGSPMSKHPIG